VLVPLLELNLQLIVWQGLKAKGGQCCQNGCGVFFLVLAQEV
jgi:hypothetical protein